jgi:hypothetical protein
VTDTQQQVVTIAGEKWLEVNLCTVLQPRAAVLRKSSKLAFLARVPVMSFVLGVTRVC